MFFRAIRRKVPYWTKDFIRKSRFKITSLTISLFGCTIEGCDEGTDSIGVCCPYRRHHKRPRSRAADLFSASQALGISLGATDQSQPIFQLQRKRDPFWTRPISAAATPLHASLIINTILRQHAYGMLRNTDFKIHAYSSR